jgi:hypothetical protein
MQSQVSAFNVAIILMHEDDCGTTTLVGGVVLPMQNESVPRVHSMWLCLALQLAARPFTALC